MHTWNKASGNRLHFLSEIIAKESDILGRIPDYTLLIMPPSTNVPLIIHVVPAVGIDMIFQQRSNQDEQHSCALTQPRMFTCLTALFWLMLQDIEGALSSFW